MKIVAADRHAKRQACKRTAHDVGLSGHCALQVWNCAHTIHGGEHMAPDSLYRPVRYDVL